MHAKRHISASYDDTPPSKCVSQIASEYVWIHAKLIQVMSVRGIG